LQLTAIGRSHEREALVSLKLYFHPLASYCWKVLLALYENGTPFEPHIVNLADALSAEDFKKLWPIGKFPVLRDDARGQTIPESSIIIEYLAQHYPGPVPLVPADADLARDTRLHDRFFDLHVHEHMQKIVGDRLRPPGSHDPHGVAQAKAQLGTSYDIIDREMAKRRWAVGEAFSMADCAVAPALYYSNRVAPFDVAQKNVAAYLCRLMERPSFVRVMQEAQPYFALFPE
jgi:glutathione S-transferase